MGPTNILCTETQISTIEAAFADLTSRKDIAILLINQHVSSLLATARHQPTPDS